MIIRSLIEPGWMERVAAMVERRAPTFLAAGDVADGTQPPDIEPMKQEIIRRFREQRQRRRVDFCAIAEAVGVSPRVVRYHTRFLRRSRGKLPRQRKS